MPQNQMDLTVAVSVGGNAEVKRALNDLGKAVRDTGKQIEEAGKSGAGFGEAGKAINEVLGKLGGLAGGAGESLGLLGEAFTATTAGITGTVAAVALVAAAMATLAVHAAEVAKRLQEGATRTGTTTDNYQGLAFALEQSGSSAEGMEKALGKISEAQGKAIESANDYGEAATKIKAHNEAMRESAEKYADAVARINQEHSNSKEDRERGTAEALYRNQVETDRALATDAQAGGKRRAQIIKDQEDKIFWIKRDARLKEEEDQRRAQREQQRLSEEHYRQQQDALQKYNLELEAEAEKAAKSLDKFSKLGVELLNGSTARDTVEVYKDVANAIARIQNPAEQAAKAVELFGRRFGQQLVESLSKGSKGIDELIGEAERLGIILPAESLKAGKEAGESFEKMASVIGGVFNRVGLAFAPLLKTIADAISETLGGSSKDIGEWATQIAGTLKPLFEDIAKAIKGDWGEINNSFVVFVAGGMAAVIEAFKILAEMFRVASDLGTAFGKVLAEVIIWIVKVYDAAKEAADAVGKMFGSSGSAPAPLPPSPGYDSGGQISGPFGIDRVPAMLTAGEYVISKPAVDHYGPGMMGAINARHFALGGLVDPAPLAFAGGGSVPSAGARTPVHLHLDGKSFAMHADDNVVGSLTRYAAGRQMSSAGPKPSWYGGAPA